MMNNAPMNPMQLIQMLQKGGNPQQLIMQAARQHPAVQQAMQAVNGKTPEEIRNMAQQLAQQRGIDLNQMARQLGIKLPQ